MSGASAEPKPKVLIAGAGIAGPVAGLALVQRGIEVEAQGGNMAIEDWLFNYDSMSAPI